MLANDSYIFTLEPGRKDRYRFSRIKQVICFTRGKSEVHLGNLLAIRSFEQVDCIESGEDRKAAVRCYSLKSLSIDRPCFSL